MASKNQKKTTMPKEANIKQKTEVNSAIDAKQQRESHKGPKNKVLRGIITYLKDWRNWLVHGLVGIGLLLLAIFAPIEWWIKVIIFACVIIFNCVRMSLSKKKKK